MSEKEPVDPDWNLPYWQNAPLSRAILHFLRSLTPDFQVIGRELTDSEWTAFKALAKRGAIEGIVKLQYTHMDGKPRVEHYLVQGDYGGKENSGNAVVLADEPTGLSLEQARLTSIGEGWAGQLTREAEYPNEARGLVLTIWWRSPDVQGSMTRTMPNRSGGIAWSDPIPTTAGLPPMSPLDSKFIPTPWAASPLSQKTETSSKDQIGGLMTPLEKQTIYLMRLAEKSDWKFGGLFHSHFIGRELGLPDHETDRIVSALKGYGHVALTRSGTVDLKNGVEIYVTYQGLNHAEELLMGAVFV